MKKVNKQSEIFFQIYLYWFVIIIFTVILLYRLFDLQVFHQSEYRLQSEQNRIRKIPIPPLRGLIFDRNGNLLVNNEPAFTLVATPFDLNKNSNLYDKISLFSGIESATLQNIVKNNLVGYFNPVRLLRQVDFSIVSKFEEHRRDFPGVNFLNEPIRSYPSLIKAPHIFGYLGEISLSELENEYKDYKKGVIIGKKGIEKSYERSLQGKPGYRYVEVDALGREVKTLQNPESVEPIPGANLFLTLDLDLQVFAEELMDKNRGSLIIMDLSDGGILTLVSKPDYPPENLSGIISPKIWNELLNDPNHPMYDRSIQSVYPPGSTFKLVLALAAISNNVIEPNYVVNCPGYYRLGRRPFKCWKLDGHGRVNLYEALEQSCNVYFWNLGLKVGLDEWSRYAELLRFGKKTGIDLSLENSGNLPNKDYLDHQYGEGKWTDGLLLNLSVGQGDLVVTSLQMLQLTSIIAKKGVLIKPHLRLYSRNPLNDKMVRYEADSSLIEEIPDTAYQVVREGMRLVVHGKNGTGKTASVPNVTVAGKTGTAQNPHGNSHAWFVGFAPFDSPEVAIIVFVENGGGGSAVAAPIAGKLLRLYFKNQQLKHLNQKLAQKNN